MTSRKVTQFPVLPAMTGDEAIYVAFDGRDWQSTPNTVTGLAFTRLAANDGAELIGYEAGTVASKFTSLDSSIAARPTSAVLASAIGATLIGYNGVTVSDQLDAVSTALSQKVELTSLAASTGAGLVGWIRTATGAVARTQSSKNADVVSALDFGGATSTAIQAAINSVASGASISLLLPAAAYNLTANVIENGRIVSWTIDRSATFSGVGSLPSIVSSNYGAIPVSSAAFVGRRGSLAAPVTDAGSPIVAQLASSKTFVAGHANAAIAGLSSKHTTADNAVTQGGFFESIDKVGWGGSIVGAGANNFVEGVRAHGITEATGGSGYGVIAFAGASPGIQWKYLVGIEGDVSNSFADMPVGTINSNNFAAAFVATSRGANMVDAAFAVNPFTTAAQKFQAGYLVAGATSTHTGFKHTGSGSMGIDLKSATLSYSAMRIPNNIPMHASNNVGTDVAFFYMHTDGIPAFGSPSGIRINLGATGERIVQVGAADSGGAGFRMLRVAN
jgi:hypothetical protein